MNNTTELSKENDGLRLSFVGDTTDKLMFFYRAFKNKRDVTAQIFNDVFCEFEELFYPNGNYTATMANFKKYMEKAAKNRGYKVAKMPVRGNEVVHGMRTLWTVVY